MGLDQTVNFQSRLDRIPARHRVEPLDKDGEIIATGVDESYVPLMPVAAWRRWPLLLFYTVRHGGATPAGAGVNLSSTAVRAICHRTCNGGPEQPMINSRHLFDRIRWMRLIIGFFATAVSALSVHAVMLQVLHVPYPSAPIMARMPHVINGMVLLWAAIWLARCLAPAGAGKSAIGRIGILLLLLCCLNETLRGWFMNA